MHHPLPFDEADLPDRVSTGTLPGGADVQVLLQDAYDRYRDDDEGDVADYIPALAGASPDLFGACIVGIGGGIHAVGDADAEFSIQSVSKPFVFALVCQAIGHDAARLRLGVNSTGMPFNSVMAIELSDDRTMNPMVNAGAIATTSLVPGATAGQKWAAIQDGLSRFAGRRLEVDTEVYESEAATNLRNQGIAHLLDSYERLYFDPEEITDVYTRQCSLRVSAPGPGGDGGHVGRRRSEPGDTASGSSTPITASGSWPCWPPRGSTSGPATGSTRSACRARAA